MRDGPGQVQGRPPVTPEPPPSQLAGTKWELCLHLATKLRGDTEDRQSAFFRCVDRIDEADSLRQDLEACRTSVERVKPGASK